MKILKMPTSVILCLPNVYNNRMNYILLLEYAICNCDLVDLYKEGL